MLAPFFREALNSREGALRRTPAPPRPPWRACPSRPCPRPWPDSDSYRAARLPANLIQAQRDYFGAHTFKRIDMKGTFHTRWEVDEAKR